MSTFLIIQTPFSNVRPIDPSVQLTGQRLRNILRQHLAPDDFNDAITLFADPEPVVGAAATDWYTDFDERAVPVSDLDTDARENILAEVGRVCARIAHIADTIETAAPGSSDASYLRAAIAVPDNRDYIYALGAHPVIVAWGHKLAGAGKAPVPAGIWIKSALPAVPRADTRQSDDILQADQVNKTAAAVSLGGVGTSAGIGWLAWLLWALFLVLFLIILWIAISGCSIGGPKTRLAERLGFLTRCPMPVQITNAPAFVQSDRSAILREAIREAELALAEDAQLCRVVRREEEATRQALVERNRQQTPAPGAGPPPEQTLADEADDRVREAGGQTGEMQIVLQWDGPADLDMSVSCSDESISYSSRSGCSGGELDVDANYEIHMDRPVENIHWAETPPPGSYGLTVRNHNNRGDSRPEIPFSVLVHRGDTEQTYTGRVAEDRQVSVTNIEVE